jgi:hypothetical protein
MQCARHKNEGEYTEEYILVEIVTSLRLNNLFMANCNLE